MHLALPQIDSQLDEPVLDATRAPDFPAHDFLDPDFLAHDARNWLTVLQVYCDLLRTSGAVASGYRSWMDELAAAVERGQGLVASLLDSLQTSSRSSAQTLASSPTLSSSVRTQPKTASSQAGPSVDAPSLDLAAIIERQLPMLQRLAGENILVEFDRVRGAGSTAISESDFERILLNLVGNAIEAMPHGGRLRIALRTGLRRPSADPTLRLRVLDTGTGIAPEMLPRIFESGVSSKSESSKSRSNKARAEVYAPEAHAPEIPVKSHGFGLAIVRELTHRAGGSLRVRSRLDHGSCFEVELPLLAGQAAPAAQDNGVQSIHAPVPCPTSRPPTGWPRTLRLPSRNCATLEKEPA